MENSGKSVHVVTSYDLKTGSDCVLSVIFELSMSDLPYGLDFSAKGNVEFGPPRRLSLGGGGVKIFKDDSKSEFDGGQENQCQI